MNHSFEVIVNGESFTAQKGDIVFIGSQLVHTFKLLHDGTEMRVGQFPYDILLGEKTVPVPIKAHITEAELDKRPVIKRNAEYIMQMLEQKRCVENGKTDPFFKNMCASLYFMLMEEFPETEPEKESGNEKNRFAEIVNYVNGHFTENIAVNEVASALYMNRGKVSEIFLKYAGITLKSYINKLRISKASALLSDGKSVTEAAFECGFGSTAYFISSFKARYGVTPGKYLQENR
jgi:AraC-like DNA-binding protein